MELLALTKHYILLQFEATIKISWQSKVVIHVIFSSTYCILSIILLRRLRVFTYLIAVSEKRNMLMKRKIPAIRSKEITSKLCSAIKSCLMSSTSLKCIELQGLLLRTRDLSQLAKV